MYETKEDIAKKKGESFVENGTFAESFYNVLIKVLDRFSNGTEKIVAKAILTTNNVIIYYCCRSIK